MDGERMHNLEKDILSILVEANNEDELEERFAELGNSLQGVRDYEKNLC